MSTAQPIHDAAIAVEVANKNAQDTAAFIRTCSAHWDTAPNDCKITLEIGVPNASFNAQGNRVAGLDVATWSPKALNEQIAQQVVAMLPVLVAQAMDVLDRKRARAIMDLHRLTTALAIDEWKAMDDALASEE